MTDCNCVCSTFANVDGSPHEKEARHPNPKSCEHAEYPEPPTDEVPFVKWTDQDGNTYITVPHG